jgi:hypothetical protein
MVYSASPRHRQSNKSTTGSSLIFIDVDKIAGGSAHMVDKIAYALEIKIEAQALLGSYLA